MLFCNLLKRVRLAIVAIGVVGVMVCAPDGRAWAQVVVTNLLNFDGTNGAAPEASLTLAPDGFFYGTTAWHSQTGDGTVFRMSTNGILTNLFSFGGTNGASPVYVHLVLGPDGNFYGTTTDGGQYYDGTVFRISTDGTFTNLANFTMTNGAVPFGGLVLGPDGCLYGTTEQGTNAAAGSNYGTVFKVTTNGTLTTVVNFNFTNGDMPEATLTVGADSNLYGTTAYGGSTNATEGGYGYGTIFRLGVDGTFTNLFDLGGTNGSYPARQLTLGPDDNMYGTTAFGGAYNDGTVFRITTNGVFTSLASFNGTNGEYPNSSLMVGSDGNLYGATAAGGAGLFYGTIFQITTNGDLSTVATLNAATGGTPTGLALGPEGNIYGTTMVGGPQGDGSIFKLIIPPTMGSVMVSNGVAAGSLSGLARPAVQILGATNMAGPWVGVTNVVFTNGSAQFHDDAGMMKFYRAAVQ